MKNKILLFIKTPPPVTGATLMNQRVNNSRVLRNFSDVHSIEISYQNSLSEMGKFSIKKMIKVFDVGIELFHELIYFNPSFVYFQISPHGIAFLRDFIFVLLIKMFRKPIVFHLRGKGISKKSKLEKRIFRFIFKNQYAICLSELLAYDISEVHSGPIYFIPNGIEDYYEEEFVKSFKDKNKCSILFLSNLSKSKGIVDFLKVLDKLRQAKLSFRAIVIGAESEISKNDLLRTIFKMNLDKDVEFLGALYGKNKHRVLQNSDILIYPTHEDCFPNVILEAMMHGLPVVAYEEGAIPDMIDNGINGFLVEKFNTEQLFNYTKELITDAKLRKQMGQSSRIKYKNQFTLSHFEENLKISFSKIFKEIQINKIY